METKRFEKNDSGFVCENCGYEVQPLGYTSRDHCPHCLCSKHLDINPGDRASTCKGLMKPIYAEPDSRKGFVITYKCTVCKAIRRNKSAADDDMDYLIRLTVR